MRILQLTEYYWPRVGGTPIGDALLNAALVAKGHEVTVITDLGAEDLPPTDRHQGVAIRRFDIRRALSAGSSPAALLELLRSAESIARDFAPDVLHATMMAGPTLFLVSRLAERRPELPLVVTFRREVGRDEKTGPDTLLGRVLRRAGAITSVSEQSRRRLVAICPEVADRTLTVHSGAEDPGEPAPLPREPHLLCLGRLVELKGFDLAIESLGRLATGTEGPLPRLTIAGDGPERERLEGLARASAAADRIRFLGAVPHEEVPALLASARLVLLPSRTEGLPNVAVEAALAGRPVIGADVGGMAEVVQDGETGTIVPPDDVAALTRAVEQLLGSPGEAERRGAAAREWAMARFTLDASAGAYTRIYASLTETSDDG